MKVAAGNAPWQLLYCPNCLDTLSSSYEQDFKFPWSLKLNCNVCQSSWWVCRSCTRQRVHMKLRPQLLRHHLKYHRLLSDEDSKPAAKEKNTIPVEADTNASLFGSMSRSASKQYFRNAANGNGPRYLVARSLGRDVDMSKVDDLDVDMMMTLGHLVTTLTRTQRELLANVLSPTTEATTRRCQYEENQSILYPYLP